MKHVHADKIRQFAKMVEAGHPIEYVTQSRENEHRQWIQDPEPTWRTDWEYRVALAFVEGKPVFEGDALWSNEFKESVTALDYDRYHGLIMRTIDGKACTSMLDVLSWNKPVVTVTLPELLRRVADCMEGVRGEDYPKFSYAVQGPHMVEVTIGTHHKITINLNHMNSYLDYYLSQYLT